MPGVRLNFSGSGLSLSVGPRGASVTLGPRGTYLNTSIPGTGLYARERLSGSEPRRPTSSPSGGTVEVKAALVLEDDGTWTLKNTDGSPIDPTLRQAMIQQNKRVLVDSLSTLCDQANGKAESLGQLHWTAPDPVKPPSYNRRPFPEDPPSKPEPPRLRTYSLLDRLFRSRRDAVDQINADANERYEIAVKEWSEAAARLADAKVRHDQEQERLARRFSEGVLNDVSAMAEVLQLRLERLQWPRETLVDFDIADDGQTVGIDVDLPEIEDMPDKQYVVRKREATVELRPLPATRLRQLYMEHIHSVGLRLAAEIFHGLPRTQRVVISAYSQRVDSSSGHITDHYLYSARIDRAAWLGMNWSDPRSIDPVEAFSRFELRRTMSKTGIFKPIEPFALSAAQP